MRQERKSAFLAKIKCDTGQTLKAEESPSKYEKLLNAFLQDFQLPLKQKMQEISKVTLDLKQTNAKSPQTSLNSKFQNIMSPNDFSTYKHPSLYSVPLLLLFIFFLIYSARVQTLFFLCFLQFSLQRTSALSIVFCKTQEDGSNIGRRGQSIIACASDT